MINPFMIAGLIFLGIGALQEAADDDNKSTKLLKGPPGAAGKDGEKGPAGEAGKDADKPKKKPIIKPVSDG